LISPKDRLGQLVICPVIQVQWEVVDKIEQTTSRIGGFGSTGVNDSTSTSNSTCIDEYKSTSQ
jgi:hypothetical protein